MDRRYFLGLAGLGSVIGVGGLLASKSSVGQKSGEKALGVTGSSAPSVVEIALKATEAEVSIYRGRPTQVWQFQGTLLKGEPSCLQASEGSYLGPTIRVRRGQKLRVRFTSDLLEPTVVHWHGLHVPAAMDGHPSNTVAPGQSFVYEFDIKNRAGTYWYHAHPADRTGPQVYYGLAGLLIVSDDEEEKAGLPSGAFDVSLVLQDRTFDSNNQLAYLPGGMMDRIMGFLGDTVLVNGHPKFELPVSATAYRLRLLNASNSRIYKLAWSDGTPLTVIGTDGGLLEKPVERKYVMLAPAERIELWVDFSALATGATKRLQSKSFSLPAMGMMAMMMGNAAVANGAALSILTARVTGPGAAKRPLPAQLSRMTPFLASDSVNEAMPRTFRPTMAHMSWQLNNRVFDMQDMTSVSEEETVRLNTQETWVFDNNATGGGMGMMGMMKMPHPMHIHGLQFQVVERQIAPDFRGYWNAVSQGYVDEGWKDTVLVMPGERVKLRMRFEDYTGLFLYHCHNLEHEDAGMMRNYLVR
ncbi:multicopper oxidase family protein [Armatimonas sp.]|uniref:multicopper oxidase family protein n=1 Tax=Armatimonas sp. TaxID=1872638 RepID=UPI0037534511